MQTFARAAIDVRDHQILRNVDETSGQVTGVRRLQRGIRQTFTRTVRRDEVLVHGQTFAEVRGDRRFDDAAVRLRHQTAHTGQLADLRRRTPCAGVGVDIHRVERRLVFVLTIAIDDLLFRDAFHHRTRDQIVRARPDVDHLVVLLALGDETRRVLRLDLFHFGFGVADDLRLRLRNDEVFDTDRCARTRSTMQNRCTSAGRRK